MNINVIKCICVLQKETHVKDRQVSALKEGWSPSLHQCLNVAHNLLFTSMETGQWSARFSK